MKHVGTQAIETQRLRLRRFGPGDAEAMFATWVTDPEVTRYMRWEPHKDLDETQATLADWCAHYDQPDYYHWAITLKEGEQLIGSLGILRFEGKYPPHEWEPGYCIGRAYWGQGYTTEALRAALGYFITGTGIMNLFCCHAVANPASGAVMHKAGFVYQKDGEYARPDGAILPAKFYVFSPEIFANKCEENMNKNG